MLRYVRRRDGPAVLTAGRRTRRCPANVAGIINIEANRGSPLGAEHLGPLRQVDIPAPATSAQLSAVITFLLSDDGANLSGTNAQCFRLTS